MVRVLFGIGGGIGMADLGFFLCVEIMLGGSHWRRAVLFWKTIGGCRHWKNVARF